MKKIYLILLTILTVNLSANTVYEDEKLCNNKDYDACFRLGQNYAEGINIKKDLTKSIELYGKACNGGSDGGCFNLAVAYRHGKGVNKNLAKAVELYKKACDMGAADGCTNLAFMYAQGLGVDKDSSKDLKYSKKACEGDNIEGCYNLSLIYLNSKEFKKAKEVSIKACNKGHAQACYNLGLMYVKGDGVEKDKSKAYNFFSMSCDRGLVEGCEYAKSNHQVSITGGNEKTTVEEGLGYEYWGDVKKSIELIENRRFEEANKILDNVINAFEAKYIKENTFAISVKTQKDFDEYLNMNSHKNAIWLDFSYRYAYYYKAFIAIELKQYSKAIRILNKLTFISPNDSQVYSELGGIYNRTGRANKGLVAYQYAYQYAEEYGHNMAVALRGMGFSYIELGNISKARELYQMSLMVEPNNKIALDELKYIESLEK